jgi:hypothetical protein
MQRTRHTGLVSLAAAAALAAGTGPAWAQKTTFNPSVLIEQGYSNDIYYAGGEAPDSDTDRRIALEIPYERETPTSALRLSYRPSYVRQQEFDELDRDEHRFDLRWNGELSRRSRLRASAHFTRTQSQGSPEQLDDPELFLTGRSDRDVGRAELSFTHAPSPRWTWELLGLSAAYHFRPIEDFATDTDDEDRRDYGATTRFMRTLSRNSSLGLRYDYRRFSLEDSGDDDNHGLAVSWDSRLGQKLSLSATAGVFHSRGDTLPDGEKTGGYGEFHLNRGFERMRLELGLQHRPSSGGAIDGTSEQTSLDLALASGARRRAWSWSAGPGAARREPNSDSDTIYGYGANGFVERRLAGQFALRLRANWYDQSNDDSIFETGLAFLWYPWAGTALSGVGS